LCANNTAHEGTVTITTRLLEGFLLLVTWTADTVFIASKQFIRYVLCVTYFY